MNVLSCINFANGLVCYRVLGENTNADDFNNWIITAVVPQMRPNGTIIMDNASIHHADELVAAVELLGRHILFLPPYSPTLNPIEISYALVKKTLAQQRGLFRMGLLDAVCSALQLITPQFVQEWYRKCLYL